MKKIVRAGVAAVGEQDEAIAWVVLGAARRHGGLTQDEITSKSGTGGYVIEHLDPQWTQVAREALRIRETLVPQVCTPAKSAAAKCSTCLPGSYRTAQAGADGESGRFVARSARGPSELDDRLAGDSDLKFRRDRGSEKSHIDQHVVLLLSYQADRALGHDGCPKDVATRLSSRNETLN